MGMTPELSRRLGLAMVWIPFPDLHARYAFIDRVAKAMTWDDLTGPDQASILDAERRMAEHAAAGSGDVEDAATSKTHEPTPSAP